MALYLFEPFHDEAVQKLFDFDGIFGGGLFPVDKVV